MDAQDFRSLQEAYMEVVENQQLDELSVNKMHAYINKAEKDRDRLNKKWDQGTATPKERKKVFDREEGEARASKKIRQKTGKDSFRLNALDKLKSAITKEEVDIYDIILSHLLDEAEGSYGQTPKATAAYIARATGKGKSKTKSLALKHAVRSTADRYNSDKPSSHRSNMTQSDRDYHRGQSKNSGGDREGIDYDEFDTGASGPGGKPKGKKLERQRKRGISAESYDIYDLILSHLLDEGYAKTPEAAEAIMANMSEEWRQSIIG